MMSYSMIYFLHGISAWIKVRCVQNGRCWRTDLYMQTALMTDTSLSKEEVFFFLSCSRGLIFQQTFEAEGNTFEGVAWLFGGWKLMMDESGDTWHKCGFATMEKGAATCLEWLLWVNMVGIEFQAEWYWITCINLNFFGSWMNEWNPIMLDLHEIFFYYETSILNVEQRHS